MAERGDPELTQVVGGQRRQQARVDVVVAERPLVPPQAQPAQPLPDVHPVSPDRACLPRWAQSIPSRGALATADGSTLATAEVPLVQSGARKKRHESRARPES